MRYSLVIFALFALSIFSGCEEECNPPDVDALNGIFLQFDMSGEENSFTMAELQNAYAIRYTPVEFDSFLFPVDTLNFAQLGWYEDGVGQVRLSRSFPEGLPDGPPYFSSFSYLFGAEGQDWQVRLQEIELDGSYTDADCNYDARLKRFVLNDDTLDVTGSTDYVSVFKD